MTGLQRSETEVEPLTNYLVGRVRARAGTPRRGRRCWRRRSTAICGRRRCERDLPAQSYVGGVDGALCSSTRKRDWVITGGLAGSHRDRQPDGDHAAAARSRSATSAGPTRPLELDPAATSLHGWTGSVNLNRNAGIHGVNAALWAVEPGLRLERRRLHLQRPIARGMHAVYQWRNPKVTRFARRRFIAVCEVVHVELRARAAGGRRSFCSATWSSRTTGRSSPTLGLVPRRAGRSGDPRRSVDAAAVVTQ